MDDYGRRRLLDDPRRRGFRVRPPSVTDVDRLIYSDYFRRLGGVTQVVSPDLTQVYHDRLTHSLKVAQVARSMAFYLSSRAHEDVSVAATRAGALGHDIGHPPFGHHGEEVLQDWCDEQGFDASFEGNAQSFRILTRNATRSSRLRALEAGKLGLNWSWKSLAAAVKYPYGRMGREGPRKKWGAYPTELPLLDALNRRVRRRGEVTGLPVEAQIVDWADDITYAVHDVEDFYLAGFIPLHDRDRWDDYVEDYREEIRKRVEEKQPGATANFDELYAEAAREVPGLFPKGPPSESVARYVELRRLASSTITRLTSGVLIGERDDLTIEPRQRIDVELLKGATHYFVWGGSPAVDELQDAQGKVLAGVASKLLNQVRRCFKGWRLRSPEDSEAANGLYMPHERGASTELDSPRLEYLVGEALDQVDKQERTQKGSREQRYIRGVLDYLCTLTDAQVVELGVKFGIIPPGEKSELLYIGPVEGT